MEKTETTSENTTAQNQAEKPAIKIVSRYDTSRVLKVVESGTLSGAYLSGAYLSGADLSGAYLRGADLAKALINWQSHDIIAELLRRSSGSDIEKRKIAGLILISREWCWPDFLALKNEPLFDWALDTLAQWVVEGGNAPEVLVARAKKAEPAEENEEVAG